MSIERRRRISGGQLAPEPGDFGFSVEAQSQDPATSYAYGKTFAINIADGHATLFTLGHRNPQGLYVDRSGPVWSNMARRVAPNSINWRGAQTMAGEKAPADGGF
jgi:hypothetical protein